MRDRRSTGSFASHDPDSFERITKVLKSGTAEMKALADNKGER
jgi:hypothetical protein